MRVKYNYTCVKNKTLTGHCSVRVGHCAGPCIHLHTGCTRLLTSVAWLWSSPAWTDSSLCPVWFQASFQTEWGPSASGLLLPPCTAFWQRAALTEGPALTPHPTAPSSPVTDAPCIWLELQFQVRVPCLNQDWTNQASPSTNTHKHTSLKR